MNAFVAGALAGAIMGLSVQAYWLIVFSRRPLESFKRAESPVAMSIVFGGLVLVGGWVLLGGLAGALVNLVRPDDNNAFMVPSMAFLVVLSVLSAIGLMFALTFLPGWKRHIFATFVLFTGLFGLLLPNLVVAAQS